MYAERHEIDILTDASGNGTGYTPVITGRIINVIYKKNDFANGVDLSITAEATGQTIWGQNDVNSSATVAPRQSIHATTGTEALYADNGEAVLDFIVVAKDRVKIEVTGGGNAKNGSFIVIVG